jgi:hypothetical protein
MGTIQEEGGWDKARMLAAVKDLPLKSPGALHELCKKLHPDPTPGEAQPSAIPNWWMPYYFMIEIDWPWPDPPGDNGDHGRGSGWCPDCPLPPLTPRT